MKTSFLLLISSLTSHAWPIYQLHEWGTFTTVAGSDGVLLSGLQREEETLPPFVHAHIGLENGQSPDAAELQRIYQQHGTIGLNAPILKGLGRRPLLGVTVKMETPVIYFHSDEVTPFRATVKVGFDGGTISQWYPQRSGGEKLPEPPPSSDATNKPTPLGAWTFDFNKPYRGAVAWDFDILPQAETRAEILFKPGDNLGWLRARQPVTNAVRVSGGETEGYLFYRGVGRFDPGLKTTVSASETLHLNNQSGGRIPYLLVLDHENGSLRWTEFTDGIDAGGSLEVPEAALKADSAGFPKTLYQAMQTGLTRCGLNDAEARSMVETWWHSYFEAPGLRVFWVLPREATDRLLPLDVSPPPSEIVRVLVGRSEVLRPRKEAEWLAASRRTGDEAASWNHLVQYDRFGLAIQERVKATAKAPQL
jgi:hypothetical protein